MAWLQLFRNASFLPLAGWGFFYQPALYCILRLFHLYSNADTNADTKVKYFSSRIYNLGTDFAVLQPELKWKISALSLISQF